MKKSLILLFGILLMYSCQEEEKKEIAKAIEVKEYTIEQFMDNENSFANSFSSD